MPKPVRRKSVARSAPRVPGAAAAGAGAAFARLKKAFTRDTAVTTGGKGFGSTGLKVGGKLFAFVSAAGELVVKLPRTRVQELIADSHGAPYDPGHGWLMKEWVAVRAPAADWLALAREARRFVGDR